MQQFVVTPEFKTRATDILNTKKFTAVFPYMNLINREGNTYSESDLNSLVQFMGEFPYSEVAEFFNLLPTLVQPVENNQPATEQAPETETVEENA